MTRAKLFNILFWLCIIFTAVLAFIPGFLRTAGSMSDKVNHTAAFMVMSFLAHRGLRMPVSRWTGLLVLYGVIIEVVQFFLPYRSFSLLDLLADLAGIALFLVLKHAWSALSRQQQ